MPPSLHTHTLYRSDLLRVQAIRCRPHDHRCGGEEVSTQPSIAFVRRGAFVKHVGRHECFADPNHAILFDDRQPYRVSHPVAGGDDCMSILLSEDTLRSLAFPAILHRQDRRQPVFTRHAVPVGAKLHLKQQAFRRIIRPTHLEPDLQLDEMLCELVQDVIRRAEHDEPSDSFHRDDTNQAHRDLVLRTKTLLATRFPEPLPLAELARAVHASPFHLCRVFRAATGLPLHAYRLNLRLRTALEDLAEGERDTTALAVRLGFSSRGHFSDSFRRTFGLSIARFRQVVSVVRLRELSKILGACGG